MRKTYVIVFLLFTLSGAARAQAPGFQPKGDDQFKAATLYQQAEIETRNMQIAQLEFNAASRRLADIKTAQKNHTPVLLKSLGAKEGSDWDWDRMRLIEPPPDAKEKPPAQK